MISRLSHAAAAARQITPVVPALLGAACISSSAILVSLAHRPAGTTAFYRCAIALVLLGPLAAAEKRRQGVRRPRVRLRALLAGSLLGADLVLWTHAIYDVGAGVATVLSNLQVLFVMGIAWIAFRERPEARFVAALPVVLGGVVLVAGLAGSSGYGYHPVGGILYGLGTSLTYAGYLLILRRSMAGSPHVAGPLFDATVGAGGAALLIGLAVGEMSFSLPLTSLGWLALLAVLSQTLGWLLITAALPRLPAALASLLLLLQPASSLFLAALVLGERPSLLQLLGAVFVCGGVVVAARARSEDPTTAPEPTPG